MWIARGDRVKIRYLTLEDVYQMREWGKHEDELFYDYNFPELNDDEVKEWYRIKTSKKNKRCFAILDNDSKTIGYLTIKDIKKFNKCATLGIVFDPNYMNQGYGTETIQLFLGYFFKELNMKTMYLEVAKHNKRAIRCYEKCGFKIIGEHKEKVESYCFDEDALEEYIKKGYFVKTNGGLYCHLYKMSIVNDV